MVTRIGGMSSGLDTEAVIKSMLEVRQAPITQLQTAVKDNEDKISQWTQLETKTSELRAQTLLLSSYSSWRQMTASSSDSTKLTATVAGLSVDAATYSMNVTSLAKAHTVWGSSQGTGQLGYSGTFSINGQTVTVAATDTLTTIKDAINTASSSMDADHKVKAYIINNRLTIENAKTGTGYDITMSDTSGTVLQSLGILNGVGAYVNQTASADLAGTMNSVSFSGKSNTGVTDILSGVTLNFKNTGTSTLEVKKDTATIKTMIQDFITKYNDLMNMAKVQGSVQLTSSGSLDAVGKLQGESLVANLQTRARSILTNKGTDPALMDQNYNSLYKIGIWFASESNEISITDESKLDDALENHCDDVEKLFRSWGTVREGSTTAQGQGLFRQLDSFLYSQIDPSNGSITMRINTLEDDNTNKNKEITQMNLDLVDYENQLWEHFAVMEEAVNNIKSQGNYVMASIGK